MIRNKPSETLSVALKGATFSIFLFLISCGGGGSDTPAPDVDQIIPVITLTGSSELILDIGDSYAEPGFSAVDNVDGNLTSEVITSGNVDSSTPGVYTITYNVSDAAGNVALTKSRQVTVRDTSSPVVTAPNNIVVSADDSSGVSASETSISAFLTSASATDIVDGIVNVTNNAPAVFPLGVTTVTFSAIDIAGNESTAEATVTVNEPTIVSQRIPNLTCLAVEEVDTNSVALTFEKAFPNLDALAGLIALKQPKTDPSLWFGIERTGRVISFNNNENATVVNDVLDLSAKISTDGEMGLTGLAIHPNYPTDNRLFLLYNDANNAGQSTLSSFTVNTATRKASNEQVLLTMSQPQTNHNGGDMHFGHDGYLYAAFGDGGSGRNKSQQLNNLYGAMIRIDISPATGYAIPADNPYFDSSNANQVQCSAGSSSENCPEIFAHGLRNPWRWSFDSQNGDIWVADVGENTWEEINLVKKGLNYGWPVMEGHQCSDGAACDTAPYENPITAYNHDVGSSITGGYVYRGRLNSELFGDYIAGNVWNRNIVSVNSNADKGSDYTLLFQRRGMFLAAFAQDSIGEIYALDLGADTAGDAIYRLVGGQALTGMAETLSQTGCFDTSNKKPHAGIVDFHVNTELWSDGADKERQFALPEGEVITVLEDGDFDFPEGSVLMKHFLHQSAYLETRLLVLHPSGWRGYSYEWNDAQTEAILLTAGKTKNVGDYTHIYPSSSQCFSCHTSAANVSLGIEAKQLNYIGKNETKNMLAFLSEAGYLSKDITSDIGGVNSTLFSLADTTATITQQARSYLHSNCSGCHRASGPGDFMDLRFETALADMNICNVAAINGDMDLTSPNRVTPGNAANSVLLARMKTKEGNRMPPLGTLIEDTAATSVVEAWINSLSSCN